MGTLKVMRKVSFVVLLAVPLLAITPNNEMVPVPNVVTSDGILMPIQIPAQGDNQVWDSRIVYALMFLRAHPNIFSDIDKGALTISSVDEASYWSKSIFKLRLRVTVMMKDGKSTSKWAIAMNKVLTADVNSNVWMVTQALPIVY